MKIKLKIDWKKYIIIVALLFLAHWLSDISGVEMWSVQNGIFGWIVLFLWYLIIIALGDKLISNIIK